MDEDRKSESGSLNRRHFAKMHEKIQNKYLEMQKKLDKSRSMDSLTSINYDFVFEQQKQSNKSDNTELDEVKSEIKSDDLTVTHKIIVEDTNTRNAVFQEVDIFKANFYEPESFFIEKDDIHEENLSTLHLFPDNFKTSFESLNDANKESDENAPPHTPTTKISFRDKISNKILAAKEKRREKRKHRDERRESREKIDKEVNFCESNVYESEPVLIENEDNLSAQHFFGHDFNRSFESLSESFKEHDEIYAASPSPSTKVSIRDKISNRLLAAKEKQREKEKDKDKKKESRDKVEKFVLSNTKKTKVATVTVAIIEATGLENETISEDKLRTYYCRLRLGSEKRKSKLVKNNSAVVSWQELFNLNMFEDKLLELSLWEKDTLLGRSSIDLSEVEKEKTHRMRLNLEDGIGNAQLFILLTISGTSLVNTFVDLDDYWETQKKFESAWYHLRDDFTDVGWLHIIAYGAKGLSANECYCVFGLENERLQTPTEPKTNDPNWMKIFTFTITDVTSILEVTVYDEKKSEEIGKVSIPLLEIENGKAKWYALKDPTQRERAKGNNPRILLEMNFTWNLVKASMRVINPKEPNYMETEKKFDRHLFARNLSRAKVVIRWILDAFQVTKSCFEWESKKWNMIALAMWLLFCWFFKVWMVPLLLIVPFAWYRPPAYFLIHWKQYLVKELALEENDEKEEKNNTTLRQKINSLQEMIQTVQNFIGKVATLGERIKNLFNFTTPFLSCLAIFFILAVAFVMFLIPFKYILMVWGIHKFTRKVLRPNRIPNNEVLDLLSRVPDDETLLNCKAVPLEDLSTDDI